jgi:phosphatidylglycerophosphate synthase
LNTPQAQEPPEPVTAESKALAEWYVDPLNRFYRYPLCNILVKPLVRTPLTPDHITGLHLGVAALAAWHISQGDLLLGALIYEIRNILDCLDGVLARAKKSFSLHGAVIDELADGFGFTMMLGAIVYFLVQTTGNIWLISNAVGVYGLSILMAMNYVLQKNRFQAPLATGVNEVELKLHERYADAHHPESGPFQRFVWMVEIIQNGIAIPTRFPELMRRVRSGAPLDRSEPRFLIRNAKDPKLFGLILLMSISTGEAVITILQVSLIMGDPMWGFGAVLTYSAATFFATTLLGNLYLNRAYRN